MKKLLVLCLCLSLLLCGCGDAALPEETEPAAGETTLPETTASVPEETTAETVAEATEQTTEPQPETFILTFAGDCTLGCKEAHFYYDVGYVKTVGSDYRYPFANVIEYFENDDFSMVNLENPLCDSGNPNLKKHAFRGPTEYVNILTQNSIQAVTIANNHSFDYGQAGYDSTLATLNAAGMPYVEADSSTIVTTDSGLTIGLYAVTYDHLDKEEIVAGITALAEDPEVDLVIFVPHWGIENTYRPNDTQIELAYAAIDAGADIVYGSHTHVLQYIEEYGDGIIYYSLGNFSFGGNSDPKDYDTAIVRQEVIREPDGTVRLGELTLIPCSISSEKYRNNYQPTPYPEDSEEYERVISKLDGSFTGPNLPND